MLESPLVTLSLFHTEDQFAVKQLILDGLVEHWGLLDPSKNPDLDDIAKTYAGSTFLVARIDGKIAGCGALVPRSDGLGEIVRMSVTKSLRKHGIGRCILQALIGQARVQGMHEIILETTAAWQEVIEFYLRCGFHITHTQDGDVYLALEF
jgi:N-acetylglutamate synthase-like GNAT family acetyltransferase